MNPLEKVWLTPGWLQAESIWWRDEVRRPRELCPEYRRRGMNDARLRRLGFDPPRRLTDREALAGTIAQLDGMKQIPRF